MQYDHCHGRLDHLTSGKFQTFSSKKTDIKLFLRIVAQSYRLFSSQTKRVRKAFIEFVKKVPCTAICNYIDISEQVTSRSLEKNTSVTHMIQNISSALRLFILSSRSQLSKTVMYHITMIHKLYHENSLSENFLRAEIGNENLTTHLVNSCRSLGNRIQRTQHMLREAMELQNA